MKRLSSLVGNAATWIDYALPAFEGSGEYVDCEGSLVVVTKGHNAKMPPDYTKVKIGQTPPHPFAVKYGFGQMFLGTFYKLETGDISGVVENRHLQEYLDETRAGRERGIVIALQHYLSEKERQALFILEHNEWKQQFHQAFASIQALFQEIVSWWIQTRNSFPVSLHPCVRRKVPQRG